jgi:hypothetical protein
MSIGRRDYILRMIEQMAEALGRIVGPSTRHAGGIREPPNISYPSV